MHPSSTWPDSADLKRLVLGPLESPSQLCGGQRKWTRGLDALLAKGASVRSRIHQVSDRRPVLRRNAYRRERECMLISAASVLSCIGNKLLMRRSNYYPQCLRLRAL